MATWDYPLALKPVSLEWVSVKASLQFVSPFNGSTETVDLIGERWGLTFNMAPQTLEEGGAIDAFFGRIAGGIERLRIHDFIRPQPQGSMRGTPTVASAAARGDSELLLASDGGLKAGDFFGVGYQLFRVFQDCEPIAGVLTVPLVQRVRSAVAVGTAVAWDRPTALFVVPALSNRASYSGGLLNPMSVELQEVFP